MNITVNNKSMTTEAGTVQALSEELDLPQKGVALAMNNRMVPRTEWAGTPLAEGAAIVIIKAACGG